MFGILLFLLLFGNEVLCYQKIVQSADNRSAAQFQNRQILNLKFLKNNKYFTKIRTVAISIRHLAGQILATYNYYFPEIMLSRCIGRYVRQMFPQFPTQETLEYAGRMFRTFYGLLLEYVRELFSDRNTAAIEERKRIGQKIAEITKPDLIDYNRERFVSANTRRVFFVTPTPKVLQEQNFLNTRDPKSTHLEFRKRRRIGMAHTPMAFVGPRQISNTAISWMLAILKYSLTLIPSPMTLLNNFGLANSNSVDDIQSSATTAIPQNHNENEGPSIFNFDDTMSQYLGLNEQVEKDITIRECTQEYTIELFWRALESYLHKEH